MLSKQYNKKTRLDQLQTEIGNSAITIAVDYISGTETTTTVFFKANISEAEETILDGIISAHTIVIDVPEAMDVKVTETTPFAKPEYRTKRAKNPEWVTCPSGQTTHIDYLITEERFVSGGEIMTKNAKEGDYVTAEVYDGFNGGIIPQAYRAALCENWPTVAAYLDKWLKPSNIADEYQSWELSTYPLNAQISQYLILRVSYHASNVSGDRKCAVNYHLTKKL